MSTLWAFYQNYIKLFQLFILGYIVIWNLVSIADKLMINTININMCLDCVKNGLTITFALFFVRFTMWLERKKTPLVYCLVGMIGAGKSTTGELLSKTYIKGKKIIYIPEPVDLWEKFGLLFRLYASFKKENKKELYEPLLFQMVAISTRLITMKKIMDENSDADIIILDSSIDVDRRVFTKMLIDTGKISQEDVVFYDMSFDNWKSFFTPYFKITRNIYLDADVEKCVSRKNDRNRKSEEKIGSDYLSSLKTYFDGFIQSEDIYKMHKSVNANDDPKSVVEQIKSIISDDIKIFRT